MRRAAVVVSLVCAAVVPGWLAAHEGHAHKVMGTVAVVDATHLEIDARDGTRVSVLLTPATKCIRGKAPVAATEVKVGQRVVVTMIEAEGKKTAKEVLLGAAVGTAAPASKPSPKP